MADSMLNEEVKIYSEKYDIHGSIAYNEKNVMGISRRFLFNEHEKLEDLGRNIIDIVIFARTHAGLIKIGPGEKKLVAKENMEADSPVLPDGALYPAGIIE